MEMPAASDEEAGAAMVRVAAVVRRVMMAVESCILAVCFVIGSSDLE